MLQTLKISALAIMFAIGCVFGGHAKAQSVAAFVHNQQAFVDYVIPIKEHQFGTGPWSVSVASLIGANVTQPAGSFGFGGDVAYRFRNGWSAFAGLADAQSTATFQWSSFSFRNCGVFVGVSTPITLKFLGL